MDKPVKRTVETQPVPRLFRRAAIILKRLKRGYIFKNDRTPHGNNRFLQFKNNSIPFVPKQRKKLKGWQKNMKKKRA